MNIETLAVVAFGGGSLLAVPFIFYWRNRWGAGDWGSLHLVNSPQGSALVAISKLDHGSTDSGERVGSYRLQSFDLRTGKLLSRSLTDWEICYLGSSAGFAWFFSTDHDLGLHGRDPRTLAVIVEQKRILEKNPKLAGRLSGQCCDYLYDASSGGVFFTSNDGYSFLVDPQTLAATPAQRQQIKRLSSCDPTSQPHHNRIKLQDGRQLTLEGEPRQRLLLPGGAAGREELSFLNGLFLLDTHTGNPVELDDPKSVLILHRDRHDEGSTFILSRISLSGETVFSVGQTALGVQGKSYPKVGLIAAIVDADRLLLGLSGRRNCIVSLDLLKGIVRWRSPI